MAISRHVKKTMEDSSWIRKMFEEGVLLKKKVGEDKVFDLSLGNPIVEPPREFTAALKEAACEAAEGMHRYMPNAGYDFARDAVAKRMKAYTRVPLERENIIMTVGAAGAANVVLKSILDPGDEVVVLNPFFCEYMFYIDNHGGKMILVDAAEDFSPDLEVLSKAITPRTKAMIINSPNNPTGAVYTKEQLTGLCDLLREKSGKNGRPIYLIADEPYRAIAYDCEVPCPLDFYDDCVVVTSHSKDLALPGERIGHIAAHPKIADGKALADAMTFTNRTLGFINAPAIMQRVTARLEGVSVDVEEYREKRDVLVEGLEAAGYDLVRPQGSFYMFPKTPVPDDVAFTKAMLKRRVLVVPGVGFGKPGYFRIAYCVPMKVVQGALEALKEAARDYGLAAKA